MRPWADFKKQETGNELFYDLEFDRDLIEASFAMQYGIRLSKEDMRLSEFLRLLGGLMENTPLGKVVCVRMEDGAEAAGNKDRGAIKIKRDWNEFLRGKGCKESQPGDLETLQKILERAFG